MNNTSKAYDASCEKKVLYRDSNSPQGLIHHSFAQNYSVEYTPKREEPDPIDSIRQCVFQISGIFALLLVYTQNDYEECWNVADLGRAIASHILSHVDEVERMLESKNPS